MFHTDILLMVDHDHFFRFGVGVKVAVKRIVSGKWGLCSGQACVGVDYLLVQEKHASEVVLLRLAEPFSIFSRSCLY